MTETPTMRTDGMQPTADAAGVPVRMFGRDLSWLQFNERVLHLARDPSIPLLERVRFLVIFSNNLDEFFMKRYALLRDRLARDADRPSHDGLSVRQQLAAMRTVVARLMPFVASIWRDELRPALAAEGIRVVDSGDLDRREHAALADWFRAQVFPILTPLSVDPGHRFPFISNLSENLGVLVSAAPGEDRQFARLKIPDQAPRLVPVPPAGATDPRDVRLVPLEHVIIDNLADVFPGMHVDAVMPFRVTRSVGLDAEQEPHDNLLEQIEEELRQRRFADAVRLETGTAPDETILALLLDELGLDTEDVFKRPGPLEYADLMALTDLDRPDLKQPRWRPVTTPRLRDPALSVFSVVREGDVFVHHPYDSFHTSVERFVAEAAADPNVLAIKQTLYRTSRDSPFIESLIRAAEAGKAVACLVELRARFDEHANVRFARQLEEHGVHVAYGVVGLKTHCKCSLVVRREGGGLRRYAHIGTGNYHPGTAQLYTDCGLITCDPLITEDVLDVFNHLTGRTKQTRFNKLLVSPVTMRKRFVELIRREADNAKQGKPARIIAKMNSLEDPQTIEALYDASRAGVPITLIVRGFCCLRPGVAGLSDTIAIRSIVGRFLEHARVFHFANGKDDWADGDWFIGSADWMSRNLSDRVEVITPLDDRAARSRLAEMMKVHLDDRRRAWQLTPDGRYELLTPDDPAPDPDSPAVLGSFEYFCRQAIASDTANHDEPD